MLEKRWEIAKHDRRAAEELAARIGVRPLTAALLIARGYDTVSAAKSFLDPSEDNLCDPLLLAGMDAALERLTTAVANREKVLIWGDYDVDGTTGTVLLRKALRILGIDSEYHVPNRFTEGYGLNIPAMAAAKERGCSLVITVDCGIRSFEPLEWARDNGLDVIVTDHHISDAERGNPPAVAVVNPNQPGCPYPDKDLAGVGVAYKLAQALLSEHGHEEVVQSFLKIAAIGTVADVMRLCGENRAIVALGLRGITSTTNFGLRALMEVAGCRSDMTSYDIGFRIAPRINAAGRMDIANHVIELFEAESFGEARKIAELLDKKNRERQTMQQLITEKAIEQTGGNGNLGFVVVAGEGWHRGVVGLAASRIAERLHRPTIVFSTENGIAHGSARSILNFHLLDALSSCGDLFDQYGGHAAAAGMKMPAENIDDLRYRLNTYAENAISIEDRTPILRIDARVASQSLSLELLDEIAMLEPFGAGNPKPIFLTNGLEIRFDPTVMKERHLKIYLIDSVGRRFEAVWWDGVERSSGRTLTPGTRIQLAYTPEANKWQGNTRLQLVVEDIREHN